MLGRVHVEITARATGCGVCYVSKCGAASGSKETYAWWKVQVM